MGDLHDMGWERFLRQTFGLQNRLRDALQGEAMLSSVGALLGLGATLWQDSGSGKERFMELAGLVYDAAASAGDQEPPTPTLPESTET
jgi:hypothetical protein